MICDDRRWMMMLGSGRWCLVLIDHVFLVMLMFAEGCFWLVMVNDVWFWLFLVGDFLVLVMVGSCGW
jgi:hypothetical protein